MAAPSFQLIGPPKLHENNPSSSCSSNMDDTFMQDFNEPNPTRGLTENLSPTFMSTGNPCLDFFFHIVPDTPPQNLVERLSLAWKHSELTTLKLICHLRGVRGVGKSDKEGFYTAALWLHKHHPKTLACNVKSIADFGYFKDLPEILYRLLQGSDVRKVAKREFEMKKKPRGPMRANRRGQRRFNSNYPRRDVKSKRNKNEMGKRKGMLSREKRLVIEMKKVQIQKKTASELRKEKEIKKARKAIERCSRDPDFRFLHDQISQVFADYLISDLKCMKSGELGNISLAAKWCPSLDSSFDKATLLCENIARKVFPRNLYPEYEGVEEAHYAYRIRDRLRKEVLVPLRRILELPEVYMSKKKWDSLPYDRVASVAMTSYKKHFLKHDEKRFNEFLGKVTRGEAKIAAGALFPHDIIAHLDDGHRDYGQVAELQWKRMVEDLSKKGKLKNCIAICDVSESMTWYINESMQDIDDDKPLKVCIALGLLLSELCENPWNGKVITFSAKPQLHVIQGDDLRSKKESLEGMESGLNTNFQKVFDMILKVATEGNLDKDQMIKRVFVFSDMEFDEASGGNDQNKWDTDYEIIQKKFEESGYGVPEIVFWNLRESKATPVMCNQKGVALVSGFSQNLIKLFLNDEGMVEKGPEAVMELALSGPAYQQLAVVD
ncbi:hypothetical protein IFM89_015578 [Coptis chinensis]|uniref:Uncharacterized protein n=1 Tax=Coptis chinensis TaxID=261450 RepID=A0A835LV42_9MAGN|nr:hypothetical protein IFM89_015578 [Coptis chinensis]